MAIIMNSWIVMVYQSAHQNRFVHSLRRLLYEQISMCFQKSRGHLLPIFSGLLIYYCFFVRVFCLFFFCFGYFMFFVFCVCSLCLQSLSFDFHSNLGFLKLPLLFIYVNIWVGSRISCKVYGNCIRSPVAPGKDLSGGSLGRTAKAPFN